MTMQIQQYTGMGYTSWMTNVARIPQVRDGAKLCGIPFYVHMQQQKLFFRLLKDVNSDFTETNCIIN